MTKTIDELVTPLEEQASVVEDEGYTDEYAKGFDEGRAEKAIEVARNMTREGFDPIIIAKMTGLPLSAIKHLG